MKNKSLKQLFTSTTVQNANLGVNQGMIILNSDYLDHLHGGTKEFKECATHSGNCSELTSCGTYGTDCNSKCTIKISQTTL